jgi:hypothetical protein
MYVIDPNGASEPAVLKVGCVTAIDGIDTTVEQNEVTCLEDLARRYEAGLATPGNATFAIQFDPADASHVRMHELKVAGTSLHWAIGFSDKKDLAPTITIDSNGDPEFVPPAGRSWIMFDGFMSSYPFNFALNAQVASTVGIQISGEPAVLPKSA